MKLCGIFNDCQLFNLILGSLFMYKILFSALLALSALPSIANAQNTFDVYILAGQSNTDGRAEVSDLSGAQLANLQNNAIISYLNPGSERERANPTSNPNDLDVGTNGFRFLVPGSFSVDSTSSRSRSDTFGPELAFGASIAEATGTNNQIAIIKVSRGGTNLRNDWRVNSTVNSGPDEPEGFLYRALLEEVNDRLADLRSDGSTAIVKGFIWHQGESDSTNGVNSYVERYIEFVESVRDEFGENIPFVVGELSRARSNSGTFNANLNQLVADSANNTSGVPSNISLVSSLGLETPSNDTTHFNADGQLELGQRFATAIAGAQQFIDLNGDFRDGLSGWTIEDGRIDLSGRGHDDDISARLRSSDARLTRRVSVLPNTNYRLRGRIETNGRFGFEMGGNRTSSTAAGSARDFKRRTFEFNTGNNTSIEIFCEYRNRTGRFDNITLENLDF